MSRAVNPHPRASQRAFTLVELLSVIAIVGVLAALVIGVVGSVRQKTHSARCGANLRQIQSLALIWAQDNQGWVPQAQWSTIDIHKLRVGATNLRSVGFSDGLGKCGSTDVVSPNYGINSRLTSPWGDNYVHYYERGIYKLRDIMSPRTILFAETAKVSGWSIGGAGAYMAAANTLGAHHAGKAWVGYSDGHVELKPPSELVAASVWTNGLGN